MTSPSSIALTGFIAWALLLLVLMEVIRAQLVLRRKVPANGFTPDNAGLPPFMQRLARAHANCVESLPVFGGLLLVAIATDRVSVTDSLAYLPLGQPGIPVTRASGLVEPNCGCDSLHGLCRSDGNRVVLGLHAVGTSGMTRI